MNRLADVAADPWRPLVRWGAVAAIVVLVMIPLLVFGRAAAVVGLVTGVTMLVPPNTGRVGLVVAMLSLIPTAVWLALLARGMLRKTQLTSP